MPMTDLLLVLLRVLHIVGAVFWAGGTFLLAGFHEYVLDPGDPERTIQRMAEYDRMSTVVGASGMIAVLAGLGLYWIVSGGLARTWITSPYGLTITVGALAGLASVAVAFPTVARTNDRATELYETVSEQEGLTAEQAATVEQLHGRLRTGERLVALLLLVAVTAMGVAQYV